VSVGPINRNIRRVLSYDVLRQQKTGVMTKGVDLISSPAYNVEPVTNTSSSSCANNRLIRRGECSTLAAVRRGFVFHASRLVRLTTLQTCICSEAIYSSRIAFFAYRTCIRRPR